MTLADALRPLSDPVTIQVTASRLLGQYLKVNRVTYSCVEGDEFVVMRDYAHEVPSLVGRYPATQLAPAILGTLDGNHVVVSSVTRDISLSSGDREACARLDVEAFVGVPLIKNGSLHVGVGVHSRRPRDWTASEIELIRDAAERTWEATERARTLEALHSSDARLRALYGQMVGGVAEADLTGRFVSVNRRYCEMVGYSSEELLTMRMQDISHPDDYARNHALVQELFSGGRDFDIEKRYIRKDGSVVWVRNHVSLVANVAGYARGILALSVDITERKRQEEELRRWADLLTFLIDRSPTGFYIVDADLRISHMNADSQARAFRNVNPAVGRRLDEAVRVLWPEPLATEMIATFRHTLETGAPYKSPGLVGPRADLDSVESYEWQLQRITMPDGRHAVVCYFYDTTELRAAENELRESARRKDEFLATLAHELRNPLAPLRNGLHLLRHVHTSGGPVAQGVLQMMERQLSHLVRMVDDLLDVSRLTRGTVELRRESIDLHRVVAAAVESCRPAIDGSRHTLELVHAEEPLMLHADGERLVQVLASLLHNAAKFTDSGGHIRLEVSVEGPHAVVTVSDNGSGIAPEMLEKVFEPFLQGSGAHAQGGLGIGLTLARSIAVLHGGTLEARSEGSGKGSTFVLRVPLMAAATSTGPDVAQEGARHANADFASRPDARSSAAGD